jgi:hypothetical protein
VNSLPGRKGDLSSFRQALQLCEKKNFGINRYNQAQRAGSAIDKGAKFARQAFDIVSPALRELGVNTGRLDQGANKAFSGYNQLRDRVQQGNEVVQRTAGRLAALPI